MRKSDLIRALRDLAEHHKSYSDEVGDVEHERAIVCEVAARMIESKEATK